jgi:hypothetical protein
MPPKYHLLVMAPLLSWSSWRPIVRNTRAHAVPSGAAVAKRNVIGSADATEASAHSASSDEKRRIFTVRR